ncbi:hypothetical protein EXU85_30830 [Spirosoma sp. KCTC 42546]|uniref:hypothetical protein n=1 Tax=Spirosoma sp. KCTC 42546 TaxID=2520506 RepID=UPI00115A7FCB|nr:hypothetical protein [Spirosoma sp. KCTC 42546]QDK82767.1 hypothetical protein EXU85_30830 [Spirosoma sp. KCTC 42546]
MWFKNYFQNRRIAKQLKRLTEAERQAILDESPLEHAWYQGEGYHIFQKNEPDHDKAYVASVGETYQRVADDWIIRQYLLAKDENRD